MTALTVLVTAAFAPMEQRKAAWWGTAFSIACRESAREGNTDRHKKVPAARYGKSVSDGRLQKGIACKEK